MEDRMIPKFKTISSLSASILIAGLLICFWGTYATAGEPTVAMYIQDGEPILDWDPSVESGAGMLVLNNVYETLLRYDAIERKIIPLLATEYTQSNYGMTWTFKIRKGVRFHDGSKLDAKAVKYSIERTMKLGKGMSYIWLPVQKITVVNKYTVKFDLEWPAPLDLIATSNYAAFIMSPKAVKSHSDDWLSQGNAVGTGPYVLQKSTMGEEAVLRAFDDYWNGWGKKRYDFVVVKKIIESSSRRQMIEKGDASATIYLPPEDLDQMKSNPDVTVNIGPSLENTSLMLNTQIAPLNNKLVRQAFAYAFPYKKVVKYAAGGYATQSTGAFPAQLWGHDKTLFRYTQDLEKAKKLLEQAGYSQNSRKLLYTYVSTDEAQKKTAEMYKSDLAKIGVEVELRGMPWESQWELAKSRKTEDRQDIFSMMWWPDYSDPYSWVYNMFHSQETILFNLAYWSDPKFDKLIDDANYEMMFKKKKSLALYREAQEMLLEENPSIFLYDKKNTTVTHKSLKGYKDNPAYPNVIFFHDTYPE